MRMRKCISMAAAVVLGVGLTGCIGGDDEDKKPLSLSIFHMNDTHSHIASEDEKVYIDGQKVYYEAGGYARMVQKLRELREVNANSLTLHAGDVFQGTLYYSLFKGEADAKAMNMLGLDAYVLGNHSFDDGDEAYAAFLEQLDSDISVVSANIVPDAGNILEDKWKPYVIKEIDGQKVGIIGITVSKKTKESSNPSDEIKFLDELEVAQKYIDELTSDGVDKIILLTHQGYQTDIEMAKNLKGVDVIVGGDSHTYLGEFGAFASGSGDYPTEVEDKDGNRVCIVQAGQYAKILGNLKVEFDENGEVSSCGGEPILLIGDSFKDENGVDINETLKAKILDEIDSINVETVKEDNATLEIINEYTKQVDEKKNIKIGVAGEDLIHLRIPGVSYGDINGTDFPKGSEIAPIVAKSFYDLSNRADACIQNAGGVRISIKKGDITMGTAYELLPFANTLFEIEMTGSEIKQVLEDALANYLDNDGSTGSFPYAYALRYDIDPTETKGSRVYNLEIKDRATGAWGDIDDDKMYVIVTNSYIASGKDGYTTFATVQSERGAGVDTYLDYAMSFVRYVEKKAENNETVLPLPEDDHPIKSYSEKEPLSLTKIGSFETDKDGGAEIVAYDNASKRMFVTNGADNKIDIVDISDIANPKRVSQIDISPYGTGVNSVAVKNEKLAVAVEIKDDDKKHDRGKVVIFDTDGNNEKNITVGYLPDMVTFNEDGSKIIVANEGEPNKDYSFDPIGSVGVIDVANSSYVDIDFSSAILSDAKDGTPVRLGGTPSNDKAKDLEPEYITVSGDFAYVTLQENNAIAKINIKTNSIEYVKSLGAKSWEADSNNTIDIEEEGEIKMKSYKGLFGLYQPDSIASYEADSKTYLVTANEGDGREYDGFEDEEKIKNLDLDDSIKSEYEDENDLKVMIDMGDINGDGEYEKLYAYGARSFSIWDENGDLIFDSGDEFGKKVAELEPELFNHDDGEMDGRSGNKGVEPEALTVGKIGNRTYAFIGLERQNAIMIYDITNPTEATFENFISTDDSTGKGGDISPEGMQFISAEDSPNGKDLLLVSFEVSGSTVVYEIK